ncbi:amino acid ABC transporter permease, partial [Streptococcus pneumoniae]|nr:amino acid ABC transporter permease [Streptococcus pneumoniae]
MDWSIVEQYLPLYQKAFFLTLHIAVWRILGSFLLGLIVSIIRHYRIP